MGDLSSAYICAQNALVARMCFLLALCTARGVHWTRLLKTLHINSLMGNLGNRDPFGQRVWDFFEFSLGARRSGAGTGAGRQRPTAKPTPQIMGEFFQPPHGQDVADQSNLEK